MAYQQSDLTALEAAIALGAIKVRYADGREVTYRSLADMRSLANEMRRQLGMIDDTPRSFIAEHRR
jgi:hypothetical protein